MSTSKTSLRHALLLLAADKITDRSAGHSLLREIFKFDANCQNLGNTQTTTTAKDGGNEGNYRWLQVFQVLFGSVGVERAAAIRVLVGSTSTSGSSGGSGQTAIRRLQDAGSTVRWLISRALPFLTRRTISCIFAHLTQSMIFQGKLLAPIALDYVKSLKMIVGCEAHLMCLEESEWRSLMKVCWGAVSGERRLDLDGGEWEEEEESEAEEEEEQGEQEEEEEIDEAEKEESVRGGWLNTHGGNQRRGKRKVISDDEGSHDIVHPTRTQTRTSTSSSSSRSSAAAKRQPTTRAQRLTQTQTQTSASASANRSETVLSPEIIELASIIPLLLSSTDAPILPHPKLLDPSQSSDPSLIPRRCGVPILRRTIRFLRFHQRSNGGAGETSCHRPIIIGLVKVLDALEMNFVDEMTMYAKEIWGPLVELWGTRDHELREYLIVGLRILGQFIGSSSVNNNIGLGGVGEEGVIALTDTPTYSFSKQVFQSLTELIAAIPKDLGGKRGILPLDLSLLVLELGTAEVPEMNALVNANGKNPFFTSVIHAAPDFTTSMAISWTTLQIQADCIAKVYQHLERHPSPITQTKTHMHTQKKRKTADPVSELLGNAMSHRSESRIIHIQTLFFLVSEHWASLHDELQNNIQESLLGMFTDTDPLAQQWSMLALTAIFVHHRHDRQRTRNHSQINNHKWFWTRVWNAVIRKTGLAAGRVARSACLLAGSILASNLLDNTTLSPSLQSILRDISVQGPIAPYDSVCTFLAHALAFAAQDANLFRAKYEDSVISWFGQTWPNLEQQSVKTSLSDKCIAAPRLVTRLIHRLTGVTILIAQTDSPLLICQSSPLVKYLIADNANTSMKAFLFSGTLPSPLNKQSVSKMEEVVAETHRLAIVSEILLRRISTIASEHEDSSSAVNLPTSKLRVHLAIATLSIYCQARFVQEANNQKKSFDRHAFLGSCRIFTLVLNSFLAQSLRGVDQAFVLQALAPILGPCVHRHIKVPILLRPGPFSGVVGAEPVSYQDQVLPDGPHGGALQELKEHLIKFWQTEQVYEAYAMLPKALKKLLLANDVLTECRTNGHHETTPEMVDEDDFAPIKRGDTNQAPTIAQVKNDEIDTLAEICVRAILLPLHYRGGSSHPVSDKKLLNLLFGATGSFFLSLATPIATAIASNIIEFTFEAADCLLEAIRDFLESPDFIRSSEMRRKVINLLQAMLFLWKISLEQESDSHVIDSMRVLWQWLEKGLQEARFGYWKDRVAVINLFVAYLYYDPGGSRWTSEGATFDRLAPPHRILFECLEDTDFRVRFSAASSAASLLLLKLPVIRNSARDIYTQELSQRFLMQNGSRTYLATRLLCIINAIIAHSSPRPAAIYHIYDMAHHEHGMIPYVHQAMQAATASLDIQSLSKLYLTYASGILPVQVADHQDPSRIPMSLYGYSNKNVWAGDVLDRCGPTVFVMELEELWIKLNAIKGLAPDQTKAALLPAVCAIILSQRAQVTSDEEQTVRYQALEETLMDSTNSTDDVPSTHFYVPLIAHLFLLVDDTECISDLLTYFSGVDDSDELLDQIFERLPVIPPSLHPKTSPSNALFVADWLYDKIGKAKWPGFVLIGYGLHLYGKALTESPLVSERQRLLRSLAMFLARWLPGMDFAGNILKTVLRFTVRLLPERDLAAPALVILRWTLKRAVKRSSPLREAFNSVLEAAEILTSNQIDPVVGREGMKILLACLTDAARDKRWSSTLSSVLLLWPGPLPAPLQYVMENATKRDIDRLLLDPIIKRPKYMLVNVIKDAEGFATAFWQLRTELPTDPQLETTGAYLDMLYQDGGKVQSPSITTSEVLASPIKYLSSVISLQSASGVLITQGNIITLVYNIIAEQPLRCAAPAYEALQAILTETPQLADLAALASYVKAELETIPARLGISSPSTFASTQLNDNNLLEKARSDAAGWLTTFANALIDIISVEESHWLHIIPLIQADPTMARAMIPYLVHMVLANGYASKSKSLLDGGKHVSQSLQILLEESEISVDVLETVIEIVIYLRYFEIPGSKTPLSGNDWLDVDFVLLSKAALRCRRFVSALLLWEISREKQPGALTDQDEELLFEIYSHVDDPDSFYSVSRVRDVRQSLIRRLHHEENWELAFRYHGADFETGAPNGGQALVNCLHPLGLPKLAMLTAQTTTGSEQVTEIPYSLAWRAGVWDLPRTAAESPKADATIYDALQHVHRILDFDSTIESVDRCVGEELRHLKAVKAEDLVGGRSSARSLLCLREVHRWVHDGLQLLEADEFRDTFWDEFQKVPSSMSFTEAEMVLSVRLSLLQSADSRIGPQLGQMLSYKATHIQNLKQECGLLLSTLARRQGHLQQAINALTQAQNLISSVGDDGQSLHSRFVMDFAEVLWIQGEHKLAIDQLRNVTEDNIRVLRRKGAGGSVVPSQNDGQLSKQLSLLGKWSAEARQADPAFITTELFAKSIATMPNAGEEISADERSTIYHQYAVFADHQQASMASSPDLARLLSYRKRKDGELASLSLHQSSLRKGSMEYGSTSNKIEDVQKEIRQDQNAIDAHQNRHKSLVLTALAMYANSMIASDTHDDSILRLVALWMQHHAEGLLNQAFEPSLSKVPSYKFASLVHQLTARLQPDETPFQRNLRALLCRLCRDHPFHVLYQVITTATPVRDKHGNVPPTGRERAACGILKAARAYPNLVQIISEMVAFATSAEDWAKHDSEQDTTRNGRNVTLKMPPNARLAQLRNMHIPIATLDLAPDVTLQYNDIVTIQRYEAPYKIAGGIHRPKITTCIGSDGQRYTQLFKAHDDLRQDAVMEQVFRLINTLLNRNEETRKRQLRFRTYNVIPLADKTGLIEFVGNTQGIGEWLTKAHPKYRPTDLTPLKVKTEMRQAQESKTENDLINTFIRVRHNFRPVMRHFFTEKQQDPMAWFAMRLCYSRSMAVGCMAGYVLGLGDRHGSNILIDRGTGELIHIDLGIAFEQGKSLRIPELVPFRLTSDMVDGLGSSGVEGVFRRCSEHTLRVLQTSSELVMTVLEVFKYDPLQEWTLDRSRANKIQGSNGSGLDDLDADEFTTSDKADRALATVAGKLDATKLSVEYTVNELIREARDTSNLAKIFVGWQSWL